MIGAGIADMITDKTRVIMLEAPGSLTFEVPDLPAIIAAAKARGVVTLLDKYLGNTLAAARDRAWHRSDDPCLHQICRRPFGQ